MFLEKLYFQNQLKMKNKIILASSSPRRKELFDKYGIDYTVDFVETEEVLDESLTLFKRLENIALQKAKPLQIKYPNNIIVSADTMVTFQDTNEWQGKAGAYAIQGVASKFAEKIDGDLENVIGMPMYKVIKYLEA